MKDIDFVRTSASRPELLKISTESIKKNLKYSGKIRFILHEDCLNPAASKGVELYASESGVYEIVQVNNPPIGHKKSFQWLFDQASTQYVIHWEDDYELIKEIDLNALINLMDNHPNDINQIVFSKRDIMPDKPGFKKIEKAFDNIVLTTCHHWMMVPAIWRMSYIRPILNEIRGCDDSDFHWKINRILKGSNRGHDAEWVIKNTKTYYLGKIREGKCVEHIGKIDKSVREGTYKW